MIVSRIRKGLDINSLVCSCERLQINPQEYLDDVLRRIPNMTNQQIDELLPLNWKAAQTVKEQNISENLPENRSSRKKVA